MENRLQTSFIPRRPMVTGGAGPIRTKNPPSFFMIIAVVVFIFSIGLYGGLWYYQRVLVASNEAKKQKIQEEIRNFEPELTKKLTILKTRIDSGRILLGNHVAFSSLLSMLENVTAQTIRFTEMSFMTQVPTTQGSNGIPQMAIALKGESQSYAAIAFQSDTFSKNENIKSSIFSDLNLNDKGVITFNVGAVLDPKLLSYKEVINNSLTLKP